MTKTDVNFELVLAVEVSSVAYLDDPKVMVSTSDAIFVVASSVETPRMVLISVIPSLVGELVELGLVVKMVVPGLVVNTFVVIVDVSSSVETSIVVESLLVE